MAVAAVVTRGLPRDAALGAGLLAAAVALPCLAIAAWASGPVVLTATNFLVMLVAVMGLAIFSGNSGILSFGHVAFMALGAQISATLTMPPALKTSAMPALPAWLHGLQLDFWSASIVAALAVVLVAWVSGLAIMRMSETSASIATLGFLIIVNSVMLGAQGITRGSQAMYGIPKLVTLPVAVVLAVGAIVAARLYRDSVTGLRLRAGRDNEAAARAAGIDLARERLKAWIAGAVLAGIAGAMFAHVLTVFSAKEFYVDLTFAAIVMLVVGGMSSVTGGVAGAVLVTLMIEILRKAENGIDLGFIQTPQVFGLTEIGLSIAILLILYTRQTGLFGYAEIDRLLPARRLADQPRAQALPAIERTAQALEAAQVSKRYGGVLALDDVSLAVGRGEIVGLIGPNGSGKTTLLGCIAGTHLPTGGRILLGAKDITGLPPHLIARRGIGRTFQNVRLFEHLTVEENVLAALSQAHEQASRAALVAMAAALLDEVRIGALAQRGAGTLAYGQQRRVEIARALAISPAFLLLDEPTAGMNDQETAEILAILKRLVEERMIGVLIVDHDMRLIMSLCSRIAVLNKGQKIAEGAPEQIQNDASVREAYLGRRHARLRE